MAKQKLNSQQTPTISVQLDTTNTTTSGTKIQSGWGQILGNGTSGMTKTITFPVAFTTTYAVTISFLGYKSGGASATSIAEFNTTISGGNMIQATAIGTTSFTAALQSTGTFGAAYHGFSWIAIGV